MWECGAAVECQRGAVALAFLSEAFHSHGQGVVARSLSYCHVFVAVEVRLSPLHPIAEGVECEGVVALVVSVAHEESLDGHVLVEGDVRHVELVGHVAVIVALLQCRLYCFLPFLLYLRALSLLLVLCGKCVLQRSPVGIYSLLRLCVAHVAVPRSPCASLCRAFHIHLGKACRLAVADGALHEHWRANGF